ncbi:uncharacterized protein LOC115874602 isoform X2 [Sitophilus oryzae]|uniref:Pre-mRNA cleavage complex 2 protein Pcf11 n=1 Tax=Sitophilus oryzae TaxID=7048 RepID=A0A6J2X384_SITOR|nr:uncharacterized protein LOC115874602 isoform X2 [Sitophilus oryzae]
MTTAEEIKTEYTSSLADLTFNSKPLINMLTMLADENLPNARVIVEAIEEHLSKVSADVKLPILYLIDCIVKNVGQRYTSLFSQNIVTTFSSVFKVVDEKTRSEMFKLRQTWNDVFPQTKLYAIDVQINMIDPAWPVTAQPANSIHLNPKFLKGNTPAKPKSANDVTSDLMLKPGMPSPDRETLLMQEQLIQKKKELLELQRKTLELEVLQTQVKLQEQMKTGAPPVSTNILLKPEVAKQLIPDMVPKTKAPLGNSMMNQRLQNASQPRINPVNPSLATAKPIRDPRLLRQQRMLQQQQQQQQDLQKAEPEPSAAPTTTIPSSQKSSLFENNKNLTSKQGVRDIHKDPRLSNKTDKKSKTSPKSYQAPPTTNPEPVKNNENSQKADRSPVKSNSSASFSSSSSSSLDSPTKSKVRSGSNKNKKRDKSEDASSAVNKRGKLSKNDNGTFSSKNSDDGSTFKSVKTSRNRNYIRRNLPESPVLQQDQDLRTLPSVNDSQRVQQSETATDQPPEALKPMDVDLRQLPPAISKKRSSIEPADQPSKKSKSFDMLFGNEDTDLRQLPVTAENKTAERPPTPPPPIISAKETEQLNQKSQKPDLDAIRAKLANATNREKVLSKSFNKKKLLGESMEDLDLRKSLSPSMKSKIMISPEEEKVIKSGHMTKEQEKQFLNKIFMQIEKNKLREAQEKDNEESSHNMSLQPISDDELSFDGDDVEEPPKDKDNRNLLLENRGLTAFNDKDERFSVSQMPVIPPEEDNIVPQPVQFYPRALRPPFRGMMQWRGRGRGVMPQAGLQPRPPIRPWLHQQPNWRNAMGAPHWPQGPDYGAPVMADDEASRSPGQDGALQEFTVLQEEIKTLSIDGVPRDIRIYNDTAVIFLNWDDPREISFQTGVRHVSFNNQETYLLSFGEGYKECLINGYTFMVKLGVPSREIFINDVGFECFFGGNPINVTVGGINLSVKLEGPPPQVKIGEVKRTDLVVGKINLIINAKIIVPVFLDGKVQKFAIDGVPSTLKFVDSLKRVLINDVPFNVEFGGLPKPFTVNGKKHFIRFSVLPKGVKPGSVRIRDMEGENGVSPRREEPGHVTLVAGGEEPVGSSELVSRPMTGSLSPDNRSNSPNFFSNILQPSLNNFDVISNVLSTSLTPATPSSGSYQVEIPGIDGTQTQDGTQPQQPPTPQIPPININDLFEKLVASGFVKTRETQSNVPQSNNIGFNSNGTTNSVVPTIPEYTPTEKNSIIKPTRRTVVDVLKPVTFARPETLKIRQAALYAMLYSGMQCSSCGMRFPPEASMLYSQHLDWHFRQNRKGKKNARVASSRRWYYSLTDWKNYEEIEDLEEREKNYFDQQQQQQAEVAEENEEEVEIPTVPADPGSTDEMCQVCRDAFEQFFNEEKEEWHLKNAIKIDNQTYHPVCYEDYQSTLEESKLEDGSLPAQNKLIPGLEIILDDDDDEDEVYEPRTPNEVVSLEESDESKTLDDEKSKEDVPKEDALVEDEDDDDVILNEVAPIKIVVDDDDDDDVATANKEAFSQPVRTKKEKHVDDDGFVDVGEGFVSLNKVGQIKIKSEPMDEDDIQTTPLDSSDITNTSNLTADKESSEPEPATPIQAEPVTSHPQMISSMDGNVELSSAPLVTPTTIASGARIKINISKSLPVITPKESSEPSVNSELESNVAKSDAVVEEPEIVHFKPSLKEVKLKKMPAVKKGNELTGLCSIM